jgi:putative Mg2+ transporter-C (MgtC) family protein
MEIEILLKIILAAVLGGIIGLERELSHKEAGLRTNILIAIGSTLITILSFKIAETTEMADPGRLAAQIVTGIGFLGAGAIIQARLAVHGLTTAATIWTVAAIGIAVGSGLYLTSFLITILVVIILTLFKNISELIEKQRKLHAFVVKTEEKAALIMDIKKILKESGIKYTGSKFNKIKDGYEIELLLSTSEIKSREFIEKVLQLEGVEEIRSENF